MTHGWFWPMAGADRCGAGVFRCGGVEDGRRLRTAIRFGRQGLPVHGVRCGLDRFPSSQRPAGSTGRLKSRADEHLLSATHRSPRAGRGHPPSPPLVGSLVKEVGDGARTKEPARPGMRACRGRSKEPGAEDRLPRGRRTRYRLRWRHLPSSSGHQSTTPTTPTFEPKAPQRRYAVRPTRCGHVRRLEDPRYLHDGESWSTCHRSSLRSGSSHVGDCNELPLR
jgi:hypothetical protein